MSQVRPAGPDDLAALVALDAELFGPDAWSATSLGASLASTIVQRERGEVDGYAVLTVAGDVADLLRIGVRRGARRAGLASALLATALEQAHREGAERVLLEVAATNAGALAFYARAGFAEIDRRRGYYRNGTDAVVLERAVAR